MSKSYIVNTDTGLEFTFPDAWTADSKATDLYDAAGKLGAELFITITEVKTEDSKRTSEVIKTLTRRRQFATKAQLAAMTGTVTK